MLRALLVVLVVSSAPAAAEEHQTRPATDSFFQRMLDDLGVPYSVPPDGKSILVNVPAFELLAFTDGEPVLRSRVIVGAPWHPTPLLTTYVTTVRFRPTWRPTPSMIASGEYRDRVWPPGPRNPLGLAAVRLEPGFLVYLHDTNRRDLFAKEQRALSHGCVRVEQWDALSAWILDIGLSEVHRLANGERTIDMPAVPIPVTFGYFTRFPDASGRVVEHEDIYKRQGSRTSREPTEELTASALACAPLASTAIE